MMYTKSLPRKGWIILLILFTLLLINLAVSATAVYASSMQAAHADTTHLVQRGDTLSSLARRYGTTVQAIMRANGLRSTTIYVGQRLTIPGASPGPTNPAVHVVQRGETLTKIAARYGTTVNAIVQLNKLRSTTIYINQRLMIPGNGQPPPGGSTTYTVQRGDTLSAIARRFGTTVAAIRSANNLTSDGIYAGQRLTIPPANFPTQPAAQRIQFAPGATSATVTGMVRYPTRNSYVLTASAGQAMRVELVSDYGIANFLVQGVSDGQLVKRLENSNTVWTGTLPSTQDYLIQIATLEGSSPNYTLSVEIEPLSSPGNRPPLRIQFAPGTTSATVSGSTSGIEPARYVLRAAAGQTMSVALNVDNANAYITVLHPNGDNMAGADGPIHGWSATLPVSGDYIVEVLNPGTGLANFSLTVTIQ